jgi:hypothetical protein
MPRWPQQQEGTAIPLDTDAEYRKQMRLRMYMLTGAQVMKRELDADIAEMMDQLAAPSPAEARRNGTPARSTQSVAVRKASKQNSEQMKEVWARRKALGLGTKGKLPPIDAAPASLPEPSPPTAPPTEPEPIRSHAAAKPEPELKRGRGRPKKKRPHSGGRVKGAPQIGFLTNTEFLYEHAAAHGGIIHRDEAVKAAATTKNHRNLGVLSRMTVAIAEMKNKGFLVTEGPKMWKLTKSATAAYNHERTNALSQGA